MPTGKDIRSRDVEITSREARALLDLIYSLNDEIAQNRTDIRQLRDETIPRIQEEVLGAIGKMIGRFDDLRRDLGLEERPSRNLRRPIELGPIREELASIPEQIEEVLEKKKAQSLFKREAQREKTKAEMERDVRVARQNLAIALVGVVAAAVIGYFVGHH